MTTTPRTTLADLGDIDSHEGTGLAFDQQPPRGTTGPWHVAPTSKTAYSNLGIYNPIGAQVALIKVESERSRQRHLNDARRMAASNDLHEALRAAVAFVEHYTGDGCKRAAPAWARSADGDGLDAEKIAHFAREALHRADTGEQA